jgi:hypothetical protein
MRRLVPLLCLVLLGCGSGDGSSSKPQTTQHSLSVVKLGDGSGHVTSNPAGIDCGGDCSGLFAEGASVTLTATAAESSYFAGWGGDAAGTDDAVTIELADDKSVSATFNAGPVVQITGLQNGDFEEGPGVGWTQQPAPLIVLASSVGITAYSGQYIAVLGAAEDNRHVASMEQQVQLPAAAPVYLNLAVWIYSEELCDPPWWDDFGTYVDGAAVARNDRLCSSDNTDGWIRVSLNLSQFVGQDVSLRFEISSNAGDPLASWVCLDAMEIAATPW